MLDEHTQVAVLGGDSAGFVLALLFAHKLSSLILWLPDPEAAREIQITRHVPGFHHNTHIPDNVVIESGYSRFSTGSWVLLIAVQSLQFEGHVEQLLNRMDRKEKHIFLQFTRGVLTAQLRRRYSDWLFSTLVEKLAEANHYQNLSIVLVSGPGILAETHEGYHSFFQLACDRADLLPWLIEFMTFERIHVQVEQDRRGMEASGLFKGPISLAAGMVSQLPYCGDSVLGALLATGFREMFRMGQALGLAPDSLLSQSGLGELASGAISRLSGNRSYGESFIKRLLSGEDRPGMFQRIELFMNPERFIEKEVLQSQNIAEGVLMLSRILEIAEEKRIQLPLYETVYSILIRKSPPVVLLQILGVTAEKVSSSVKPTSRRAFSSFTSGQDLKSLLEKRVQFRIEASRGFRGRLYRQAGQILSGLQKRYAAAERKGDKDIVRDLGKETELWEVFLQKGEDDSSSLNNIIRYYVAEISDRYRPGVREALIKILTPVRGLVGGLHSGSAVAHIGGCVDEVKRLASRYTLFYTPSHKSHLDSVEVAFALNSLGLPVPRYAAGKNLMTNPFRSWVLKSLGSYAVDRQRTRNILYLECLGQYSTMMLEASIPSLVFPEGTRSRTGGLVPIKTGLLSTAVDAYRNTGSEIIIVPISISYESIPEDMHFTMDAPSPRFNDFIKRRSSVYLDFGTPIEVSRHMSQESPTLSIAYQIAATWERNMRILPVHIVARLLFENEFHLNEDSLMDLVEDFLIDRPANYLTRNSGEIVGRGLKALTREGWIVESDGWITTKYREIIQYYANMAPALHPSIIALASEKEG